MGSSTAPSMATTNASGAGMEIVRALQANCERPFSDARSMPPAVYTSPDFLALEQVRIFHREWLCVGRASALAETGDCLTADIDGQPIVVLRDENLELKAFSNVCLHRMSVLLEGRGNVRRIVCPYHAWNYTLDGALHGAPMMERQSGFCKESYRLPSVRCETWQGWIYVTLDTNAPPVAEKLASLTDLIGSYGMTDYKETFYEEHVWDTNWKILAENFMESYHLPMLHRATVGPHSRLDEMECPPGSDAQGSVPAHWPGASGQSAPARPLAQDDRAARNLPNPSRHADAGLLLVSRAAAGGHRPRPYPLRRRTGA